MRLLFPLIAALGLLACNKTEEIQYEQFNGSADAVEVEVGVEELLDPRQADITSSTGEVVIGLVDVDPGGGPIGTNHDIVVIIDNEWQGEVDRVSIRTSPVTADSKDDESDDEYDLERDSADEGYFKLTLESVGAEGELRTDTLTVRVWKALPTTTDESTDESTDGS